MAQLLVAYKPLFDIACVYCGFAFAHYTAIRAGLFSFATPAFASIGAYAGAIALKQWNLTPLLGAGFAAALGAGSGLFLSLPLARLRGAFQAIATLAFMQIMVSVELYARHVTGGAFGYNGIPKVAQTWHLVLFVAMLTLLLGIINRSGIGRAFGAIRQDDLVALSLGISINRYHRIAFALSGAIAGMSGCLLAYSTYSITPEEFGFPMLVAIIAPVILGGRSSIAGPIVGTAILMALPELARPLADNRLLFQGALLIAATIYLPQGIVDSLKGRWMRRTS